MRLAKQLFQDETGVVLSAETVMIGTLGVMGTVVGLSAVASAVDLEMKEFAGAIRSLDQSYGYVGHQSCRAWTAGSYYRQPAVSQSLSDLCGDGVTDIRAIEKQVDAQRASQRPESVRPQNGVVPGIPSLPPTTVIPNQIKIQPNPDDVESKGKSEPANAK